MAKTTEAVAHAFSKLTDYLMESECSHFEMCGANSERVEDHVLWDLAIVGGWLDDTTTEEWLTNRGVDVTAAKTKAA